MPLNRRNFLSQSSACLAVAGSLQFARGGSASGNNSASQAVIGLPEDWRSLRKVDCHQHIGPTAQGAAYGDADLVIEGANALGIDQSCTSRPTFKMAAPAEVREANDMILAAMKRHPGRILGYCFLIPGFRETLPELERCLDAGMIGVKLYNQFKYSDPVCVPIVERCIDRRIPLLGHAGHLCDPPTIIRQPNISDAAEFCTLAHRYPELMLIHAHVNGGGDWEWTIKRLRDCDNVYLDTSGSVLDERTIEMAVETLGHERVVFGTDTLFETGVGKILSARLSEEQRQAIFAGNMQKILDQRKT